MKCAPRARRRSETAAQPWAECKRQRERAVAIVRSGNNHGCRVRTRRIVRSMYGFALHRTYALPSRSTGRAAPSECRVAMRICACYRATLPSYSISRRQQRKEVIQCLIVMRRDHRSRGPGSSPLRRSASRDAMSQRSAPDRGLTIEGPPAGRPFSIWPSRFGGGVIGSR